MQLLLKVALFIRDEESHKYDLTTTDVVIIFLIASHLGVKEYWFISQEEIAKECRIKPRHFRDRSLHISNQGLLEIKRTGKSNGYKLILPYVEGKNWCSDRHSSADQKEAGVVDDRHHSAEQIGTTVPNRSAPQCLHNINNKENNKKTKKILSDLSDDREKILESFFEDFWKVYPRKESKKRSIAIWNRKHLNKKAKIIIDDVVKRKAEHYQWQSIQYIPLPSSYLNGEKWEDQIIHEEIKTKTNGHAKHEIHSTVPDFHPIQEILTPEKIKKSDEARILAMQQIRKKV